MAPAAVQHWGKTLVLNADGEGGGVHCEGWGSLATACSSSNVTQQAIMTMLHRQSHMTVLVRVLLAAVQYRGKRRVLYADGGGWDSEVTAGGGWPPPEQAKAAAAAGMQQPSHDLVAHPKPRDSLIWGGISCATTRGNRRVCGWWRGGVNCQGRGPLLPPAVATPAAAAGSS